MTAAPPYSIFVNSTDSFEDAWEPFFHLLHGFWPQADPVILNTETKTFVHPAVSITATQVARRGERRIPWGECMLRALDRVPTEMFVYLQDDYFLYDVVQTDKVEEAACVVEREGLDCLRAHGVRGKWALGDDGLPVAEVALADAR